jgi:hypothetical protein
VTSSRPAWVRRVSTLAALARLLPAYVLFGCIKHLVPLHTLARLAWRAPAASARSAQDTSLLVTRVAAMGGALDRFDRNCLQRSLVLYRELSRAGASPRLCVGFRRASYRLEGHAWVEVDDQAVGDDRDHVAEFTRTAVFGDRAERL